MTWLSDAALDHLRDIADWPDPPGDRYQFVELLARGGMGTVYLARDRELAGLEHAVADRALAHEVLDLRQPAVAVGHRRVPVLEEPLPPAQRRSAGLLVAGVDRSLDRGGHVAPPAPRSLATLAYVVCS